MQHPAILRPGLIAGLLILLPLTAPATAQWAGFTDASAALQISTFSFIGTNPAAGDTNENYYDGDMGDFDERLQNFPSEIESLTVVERHDAVQLFPSGSRDLANQFIGLLQCRA